MPNVRLLSSIVAEISLIQFPFVVLKGLSNCRNHAVDPKGEVSGDELESSRQGSHMEGLQAGNGGDLRGSRYLRRDSGPSYLWQEVTKHTTAGTLLKTQYRTVRRWIRYGRHSKRALNNQLHFGISKTLIWQTSDKTNRRQQLTWISTSSRLSGGANGRRKLRRSE